MKLSIVIPVLNSHEVVRRQLLYFERMGIPSDTELILVDDGSDPPIGTVIPATQGPRRRIHYTHDKRPWTWALARNAGARIAEGEYLLMYDLDHIVPKYAIDFIRKTTATKVQFVREFGVLDEQGRLTQDRDVLEQYGLPKDKSLAHGPLPNNFAMRRDVFWELGGYREDLVEKPYPQGEDRAFRSAWRTYEINRGGEGSQVCEHRPRIFHFPNGKYVGDVDADPKGLFHTLSRKTSRNWFHLNPGKSARHRGG
jgi:glycosyltransferase involved in cell wall biosynthesis